MPNPLSALRHAGGAALAALLPQPCFVCGSSAAGRMLCAACVEDLPMAPFPGCPQCADASPRGEVCGQCLKHPPRFDSTTAVFSFAFPVRELIHALKFRARFAVCRFAAEAMLAHLPPHPADAVLAVPLHPQRLRERGFNQAMLLAEPVSRALQRPLLRNVLLREREAAHQAELDLDARRRNLRGAFRAVRRFDGMRLWVIDDVMTSGATLDEVAYALKLAGAAVVHNLVLARTP